ncbi:MAG: hypothetical protein V4594_22520 [Bacteroidota bacterium]
MKRSRVATLGLSIGMVFLCTYAFGQVRPRLKSEMLNEVSGLVCAGRDLFFVHNDSGDSSRFFAINAKGELLATLNFQGDPAIQPFGVADCEDIAMGPGPVARKNYLYLGDIGDNSASRAYISVYRFLEPVLPRGKFNINAEVLHLRYPNGAQDAEAMMVDPVNKELIIVSKRQDTVGIYTTSLAFKAGDTLTLQKRGSLFLKGVAPGKFVVAGDISRDGKQVLLKTYEKVYYWLREGKEPIARTLQKKPIELPYTKEVQGEAIGFSPDGNGYSCIGEGKNAAIYQYKIPLRFLPKPHKHN